MCNLIDDGCSRHGPRHMTGMSHMTGMRCGRASGTCGAQSKTDARLRLLGLGRLDEIIWAYSTPLVMLTV
jgi:hypothetical protein